MPSDIIATSFGTFVAGVRSGLLLLGFGGLQDRGFGREGFRPDILGQVGHGPAAQTEFEFGPALFALLPPVACWIAHGRSSIRSYG